VSLSAIDVLCPARAGHAMPAMRHEKYVWRAEKSTVRLLLVIAVSTIAKSPLLEGVDPDTVRIIASALTQETWPKGRQIMAPAETTASFRLVLDGRVKVVRSNSGDGHELTLWLLGPGDGFDIVSLLDGKPHAVTAWALDDVRTL